MFNQRPNKKSFKDEGEKPFWISYADLMTACMTLFLVVMAVTIVMLKKKYETQDAALQAREATISCLLYTSPSPRGRTRSRMPSSA